MIDYGLGVYLGPLDSSYCQQIRSWRNNPTVYKWCRQYGLISDLDQIAWFEKQNADPSIRMFGVHCKTSHDLIGVCGLTSIDLVNSRGEFSLYIAPNKHGNGFGRSALKTLCNWGFTSLGLNTIWGETFEGNPAYAMFEKVGFQKDGVRREFYFREGKFIDAILYSVKRSEWSL